MAENKSFCHLMLPLNAIRKKVLNPANSTYVCITKYILNYATENWNYQTMHPYILQSTEINCKQFKTIFSKIAFHWVPLECHTSRKGFSEAQIYLIRRIVCTLKWLILNIYCAHYYNYNWLIFYCLLSYSSSANVTGDENSSLYRDFNSGLLVYPCWPKTVTKPTNI